MPTDAAPSAENLIERTDHDGVVVLRLANGKVNALSTAVLGQLADACRLASAESPGAVVITGGPKLFAAGADIGEFGGGSGEDFALAGPETAERVADAFTAAAAALDELDCPTIAAVSGYALGGGCELALACDMRFGSERAVLGQPEILLGIIPGGGGTQRLPRLIGYSRALDLIVTGRQVKAPEALAIGLLDRVFPADTFDDDVMAVARSLAAGPRRAVALAKRAMREGLTQPLGAGLAVEKAAFAEVFTTEDAAIGVQSFQEHGPGSASFVGR